MRNEKTSQENLLSRLTQKPRLIQAIEDRLKSDDKIGINIGMEEGLILKTLCSQLHVEKVVEIGTQYGCSASWMALGLKKGAQIYCFESEPGHVTEARKTFDHPDFLKLEIKVQIFEGKALELLPQIQTKGPFDLIFIDANKAGYLDYFNWARKNINQGGLIVADNVYLFGTQFLDQCPAETPIKMWNVMRAMLNEAFSDPSFASSILPTHEGLMISVKK